MATQAKSKSEQIVQELNRASASGSLDQLTRARFRRDAEALMVADPITAHMILGLIASDACDESEVRRCFSVALKLAPVEPIVHHNYATALADIGFFSAARTESERAHALAPGVLEFADALINYATLSGRFRRGAEVLAEREKLEPKEAHPDQVVLPDLIALADQHGVRDEEIEKLQLAASSVLHNAGLYSPYIAYGISEDEESRFVGAEWQVDASVSQVVDLNIALARQLSISETPLPAEAFLTFVFVPRESHDNTSV